MNLLGKLGILTACIAGTACNPNSSGQGNQDTASSTSTTAKVGTTIGAQPPSDTTGAKGQVSIGFSASSGTSLSLQGGELPVTKKIGDVELRTADFSIASIKMKPEPKPTAEETALEEEEKSDEEAAATAFENALDDSDSLDNLSLQGRGSHDGKSNQDQRNERTARIKEHTERLSKIEHDQLAEDAKRDASTVFAGPIIFNAVTGESSGVIPSYNADDGSYPRTQFQLKRNVDVAETDPLWGNVFFIAGTVMKDGAPVPFEISWHSAINFRLTGNSPFSVKPGEDNALVIELNMDAWFDGLDWSKAVADANGTIYIGKASNREMMRQIRHNLMRGVRSFKDANHDGQPSDEEVVGTGEDTDANAG